MLVLSRKVGESFVVGDDVTITVVNVGGNKVRIGIEAPPEISIVRSEVLPKRRSEQPRTLQTFEVPLVQA